MLRSSVDSSQWRVQKLEYQTLQRAIPHTRPSTGRLFAVDRGERVRRSLSKTPRNAPELPPVRGVARWKA